MMGVEHVSFISNYTRFEINWFQEWEIENLLISMSNCYKMKLDENTF